MKTAYRFGFLGAGVVGAAALAVWVFNDAPAPTEVAGPDWMAALLVQDAPGRDGPQPGWSLDLPADHGAHPQSRSELWQLAMHLEDAQGNPVGVQVNLSRLALAAPAEHGTAPDWSARDLYRGHVVLVEAASGATAVERLSRGIDGVTGPETGRDGDRVALHLDSWSLTFDSGDWTLEADAGETQITLTLSPQKPAIAADDGEATFHGYAFSRLSAQGQLTTPAAARAVQGTAWFEHAWGDLPLPGGGAAVVSDRLQVQLDDGSDLSLVRSRRVDGGGRATVDGFAVDPRGTVHPIAAETGGVRVTRHWQGADHRWPVGWAVTVDGLDLEVTPVIDAQAHAFLAPVWSGLVLVEGQRYGQPVRGMGTMILDGEGLE